MPQENKAEQTKQAETEKKNASFGKDDVVKLIKKNKIEIIGRASVGEDDILSFCETNDAVIVVTCDGRKHTLNK